MIVYADTSFLVTLYVAEERSREGLRLLRRLRSPLAATWFTLLETANTLRRLRFQKILDEAAARAALSRLESSVERGTIALHAVSSNDFAARAEQLSDRYAARTGIRTLDLMHLAAAGLVRASHFLTYDDRQRTVATLAGLTAGPPLYISPQTSKPTKRS